MAVPGARDTGLKPILGALELTSFACQGFRLLQCGPSAGIV